MSKKKNKVTKKKLQNKNNKTNKIVNQKDENKTRILDEIFAIILIGVGAFLAVSIHTGVAGSFGVILSNFLKGLFGLGCYILPYLLISYGILIFAKITKPLNLKIILLITTIFTTLDIINGSRFVESLDVNLYSVSDVYRYSLNLESGGIIGTYIAKFVMSIIGSAGLYIFSLIVLAISIMLTINKPYSQMSKDSKEKIDKLNRQRIQRREEKKEQNRDNFYSEAQNKPIKNKKNLLNIAKNDENYGVTDKNKVKREKLSFTDNPYDFPNNLSNEEYIYEEVKHEREDYAYEDIKEDEINIIEEELDKENIVENDISLETEKIEENVDKKYVDEKEIDKVDIVINKEKENKTYRLPPISLLNASKNTGSLGSDKNELQNNIKTLENTLNSFNVDAKVVNVTKGSSITRYEIQPAVGVKVSKIVNLADDIALNLRAKSIRIEAPIPGKAAVGIEVANNVREMVTARDIIGSKAFSDNKSELAFAVGKDIAGMPIVADLAKMPHMLIAGATGAGKSVCINTIISSILFRATPDEVKLILIDPKMVELGNYNGIPHLLIPVVTDSNKAASALNWALSEMMQRYKKFTSKGVKDIKSYNAIIEKEEDGFKLPKIVIVIDELADLMMVASSQVEQAISRLAQLARAAGMHLIVATQRPSVDVVTGLIKANIPTRISFMVSSQVDSRTILDMAGAEKLVGNGDMLFKAQGMDKPLRIQGPYISDEEVHKVIEFVKSQEEVESYDADVINQIDSGKINKSKEDADELLEDAIELVLGAEQASVSMLQRRFRIGYNRAARIVDQMEEMGLIGKQEGSKPRSVNMTLQEYLESKNVEE